MLKSFKQCCKQGTEMAVGLQVEQVAVQVQENGSKVAGFQRRNKGKQETVRGPRVWGGLTGSDRGFEGNSHTQVTGF